MRCEKKMKEFTSEELLSCDGKEGKPVYIAFEGKVYDVSKSPLWSKGTHMNRHPSGKNLSGEISAAPHGPEVLERYPQIGMLKKGPPEELKHLPKFLQSLLQTFPMARRHPHPMVVHFPIAFLMASSLFYLLFFIWMLPSLGTTSTHLLILGIISTPFAIATGFLTWWINYKLKSTRFIKRKIQFSILLLAIEVTFILFWIGEIQISYYFYLTLMILFVPVVLLLGYYGGQMTFPSEK
ncbi:MAG: cytochrome b5 [Deltaproteobacteria bacterium]|nr:cytochrome b5 [Deltaproteobacteria bacterium]